MPFVSGNSTKFTLAPEGTLERDFDTDANAVTLYRTLPEGSTRSTWKVSIAGYVTVEFLSWIEKAKGLQSTSEKTIPFRWAVKDAYALLGTARLGNIKVEATPGEVFNYKLTLDVHTLKVEVPEKV